MLPVLGWFSPIVGNQSRIAAVLAAAAPLGQQVLVRGGEELRQPAGQIEPALRVLLVVAFDAMPVQNRLHVGGVVQRAAAGRFAGLRSRQRGRATRGRAGVAAARGGASSGVS